MNNTYYYGQLPPPDVFEEYFDERVGNGRFPIHLSRSASRAADGTIIGDGVYTSRELHNGLQQLVRKWENGNEGAGELASSILYSLGFEWV